MMTLAGELASTILAVGGLVVTAGAAILAAWAALKANNPKLRLGYRLHSSAELLANHGSSGLSVTHNGTVLTSPHVASVQMINQGRRDIVSTMFHNGDPVEFDLGEPILALLGAESSPSSSNVPPATVSGSKLLVPAAHVRQRQKVTYTVLLDGPVTGVSVSHSLINFEVQEASSEGKLGSLGWLIIVVLAVLLVTLVGVTFTMILPNAWVAWLQEFDNKFK